MTSNKNFVAWALLILLSLIWGSSFILIKKGRVVFSAGEVGALRILAASVCLLPMSFSAMGGLTRRQWRLLLAVGLSGSLIPSFLFAIAQTQLESAIAGIINALTPMFTMILGVSFFRQQTTWRMTIGLLLGFAGAVILMLTGSQGDITSINYYGFFVVLATILYGTNLNLIKYYLPDLPAKAITSISLLIVGPITATYLFGFSALVSKLQVEEGAWTAFGAVAILGILGTAVALIIFNHLVKLTTPIFTSSVTYLIPLVAVTWGIWDEEVLLVGHYLGMAGILAGVYITNRQ